jgi:hypothetical protein
LLVEMKEREEEKEGWVSACFSIHKGKWTQTKTAWKYGGGRERREEGYTSTYPWRFSMFIIIVRGTPPHFHCSTGPQMPVMETISEVRPLPIRFPAVKPKE